MQDRGLPQEKAIRTTPDARAKARQRRPLPQHALNFYAGRSHMRPAWPLTGLTPKAPAFVKRAKTHLVALVITALLGHGTSSAQEQLRIVCADVAPYCFTVGKESRGFIYELGQEMLRRQGRDPRSIEIQPLARAVYSAQQGKQTISLWLGRIPEREYTVRWIVPTVIDAFHIYTLAGKPDALTLENAAKLPVLAATIGGANIVAAHHSGLGRLETTSSEISNGRKLLAGRVDGWISSKAATGYFALTHQLGPGQLVRGIKLADYTAYLAASLDVDAKHISEWKSTYESLLRDGFVQRTMVKYGIPEH